ncbi:hypothetical protein H5410_026957 [Solanum commersonii]|uniref:Uncharacterized protein n=1 Tax=Solanum commersonii TaxID=4109 RepID=A0A9J5YXX8_SOLCO|nr:hypothetical protein H5410_026957 [Solanum commersonii]
MGDYVATKALGLTTTDEIGIISKKQQFLLVVQVITDESVEIPLTLDHVKYEYSNNGYFGEDHSAKLVGITDQLGGPPFGLVHPRLALAFSIIVAQHTGTKVKDKTFWRLTEQVRRFSNLHFFILSAAFTQVQPFKKEVSSNATQDSIMNAHNKTQFTYVKILCVPKDSSCDTPFSKILKLAILASNASSISTKVFECPHRKDDSILSHKDQKGLFKACNGAKYKDHSAKLVRITDQLGGPPFGLVHHCLALAFNIVVFWIIRRHSIVSRNCSATRQLPLFIVDLIISFRAQHTGTKGEDRTFGRLAEWTKFFWWTKVLVEGSGGPFIVDMQKGSCTYRIWDLTCLPCPYALVSIHGNGDRVEDYVNIYYKVETFKNVYSYFINSTNLEDHLPKVMNDGEILPPKIESRQKSTGVECIQDGVIVQGTYIVNMSDKGVDCVRRAWCTQDEIVNYVRETRCTQDESLDCVRGTRCAQDKSVDCVRAAWCAQDKSVDYKSVDYMRGAWCPQDESVDYVRGAQRYRCAQDESVDCVRGAQRDQDESANYVRGDQCAQDESAHEGLSKRGRIYKKNVMKDYVCEASMKRSRKC